MLNKSNLFDILRKSYSYLSEYNPFNYIFPPVRYFLELTYRCNLNCEFCFINGSRKKNELSTNEWFNIINQIPFYSFISLVAGEVLLREDFLKILNKSCLKTLGKVSIITNGVLLNKDLVKEFIKNNMLLLSVSVDGYKKHHDIIRKKQGLWDNIFDCLYFLDEEKSKNNKKRPLVDIKSVVLEDNLDDLPKIYKEAAKANADFYSLSFKRNNFLRQNSELKDSLSTEFYEDTYPLVKYFDEKHFREVYKELESISKNVRTKLRYAPKFNPSGDEEKILKYFSAYDKDVREIYYPCNIPFSSIFITPEGDVYPCLSVKLGNVKEDKIQKVINSSEYKAFLLQLKKRKIFNACQLCCDSYVKDNF